MGNKYKLVKTGGGWAVEMTASGWLGETFKTKQKAQKALREFERGKRFVKEKEDVWIVADAFVCEAFMGGQQRGEVDALDMNQFNVVQRLTEEEWEALREEFHKEHGEYPDE